MKKAKEKVFIAWGGNQPLAEQVGIELKERGYEGVIGGGNPTDMYIGNQVLSQISQCTRAIILAEPRKDMLNSFSSNLMFEWGFLTAKIEAHKLHVFIIDESQKSLPSDLAGIWCNEIVTREKTREEVSEEIINIFEEAASRPVEIDKMKIFYNYNNLKREISEHSSFPKYSEVELAHYVLHCIEMSDYYMEEVEYDELLSKLEPVSTILEFAIQIARASTVVFRETETMTKALSFDIFVELRAIFGRQFDFSAQDNNLNLWMKYVCNRRLAVLHSFLARNEKMEEEHKKIYYEKCIEYNTEAWNAIQKIVELFPYDAMYAKLYESNLLRGKFRTYKKIDNNEKAKESAINSSKAREAFYLHYKQRFPQDVYLIKRLAEDYYLSIVSKLEYIDDPIERKIAESTIKSYLSKVENESGKQHVLLKLLRSAFNE